MISGFLGADILAAAYAVRFFGQPQGTLLVDMGTNGELMLKGSKGITATSCATGPAFEGANIHHGMQAAPGAVDAMKLDNHCGKIEISVIKNNKGLTVKPSGICGSGILSAVAEFIRSGVVLEDGRGYGNRSRPDRYPERYPFHPACKKCFNFRNQDDLRKSRHQTT